MTRMINADDPIPENPQAGDMIYDSTTMSYKIWTGHEWYHVSSGVLEYPTESAAKALANDIDKKLLQRLKERPYEIDGKDRIDRLFDDEE